MPPVHHSFFFFISHVFQGVADVLCFKCPFLSCCCSCLWEKVVFSFRKEVEHSPQWSVSLVHMVGAQFVLAERGDLAVPLTVKARSPHFLCYIYIKKAQQHTSLQPTSAAGHTACGTVTPRGFSVSVSSSSGYFIQRCNECGTCKYEFHTKKR